MIDDEPFETDPEEILERLAARKKQPSTQGSSHEFIRSRSSGPSVGGDNTNDALAGRPGKTRSGPSLKARAIQFLSRREHSRQELARKLAPHAQSETELDALLNWLEQEKWLSTERFARSLLNRRASKLGTQRILQELRQHGVSEEQALDLRAELEDTEFERAKQVWEKKFNQAPADAKEHARQYRFMASRGFSGRVLQQIIASSQQDDD